MQPKHVGAVASTPNNGLGTRKISVSEELQADDGRVLENFVDPAGRLLSIPFSARSAWRF
jgi:hypothetical protein